MDKREFCEFEKKEKLFERTYCGKPYWQMLRFLVCEAAYSDRVEKGDILHREKRKNRSFILAVKAFYFAFHSVISFRNLELCDVICFTHNTKQAPQAAFFDYWAMPKQINCLKIKETCDPEALGLHDNNNLMVPYVKAKMKYYLKKMSNTGERDCKEKKFLQELEIKITHKFGRSVTAARMEQEILQWIDIDREFEKYFAELFEKTKCKALAVVCYYQYQLYSAYRVAREKNIKIIEFQHGVISNHEEYWFEDRSGLNNYTPDYFLAFGKSHIEWTKMLDCTKPIIVGFPYQEYQINKLAMLDTQEMMVIIYPQAQIEFEKVIDEFATQAVKKGYKIFVKLHPLQAINHGIFYPLLSTNSDIEFITRQDQGIYYWLKRAKHHVMANTTVGLQAVALGHTNICIAENVPHEQTQPLLDWGVARGFFTAEELMTLIQSPLTTNLEQVKQNLWQPSGKQNVENFFLKIFQQDWPDSNQYKLE